MTPLPSPPRCRRPLARAVRRCLRPGADAGAGPLCLHAAAAHHAAQADLSLLAGGWLAAINYAGYMSGVLLATAVGDVERKFRLYRIGLLLAVVCTAGMGLTTHVALWAALRFVAGLSSAAGMLLGRPWC